MANEKFVVCPECEGKGDVDNFGSFTSTDLDEWYGDSYERDEFIDDYTSGRIGRAVCGFCKGQRVVPEVDENGITVQEHLDYAAEVAHERRMGY